VSHDIQICGIRLRTLTKTGCVLVSFALLSSILFGASVDLGVAAATRVRDQQIVRFDGYTLRLPSDWPMKKPAQCVSGRGVSFKTLKGPAIVVGTSKSLFRYGGCGALHPKGTVIVLGYGGPPATLGASFPIAAKKVNGVSVQLFGERDRGADYFLALLPSRSDWIAASIPVEPAVKPRAEMWSILRTLRAVSSRAKTASAPHGVFRGEWAGSAGVRLNIDSTNDKIRGTIRMKSFENPTEVVTMSLNRGSTDNLKGVVDDVRFVDAHGKTVAEPSSADDFHRGEGLTFFFLTKNILDEIAVKGRSQDTIWSDAEHFCRQNLVSPTTASDFSC
jgi:hypothetical protein